VKCPRPSLKIVSDLVSCVTAGRITRRIRDFGGGLLVLLHRRFQTTDTFSDSFARPSKFLKRRAPFAHIARAGTLISGSIEVATLRSSLPASCRPNPHHITPQRNMQSLFLSLLPVQTWVASGSKTWAKPLKTRNGLLSFSSSFAGRRPWMTVVNAIVRPTTGVKTAARWLG